MDLMGQMALWLLASIGAVVLLCAGVFVVVSARNEWVDRKNLQVREEVEAMFRNHLMTDSDWFSEDIPTMNVIWRLGRGQSVDDVRRRWREDRDLQVARGRKYLLDLLNEQRSKGERT